MFSNIQNHICGPGLEQFPPLFDYGIVVHRRRTSPLQKFWVSATGGPQTLWNLHSVLSRNTLRCTFSKSPTSQIFDTIVPAGSSKKLFHPQQFYQPPACSEYRCSHHHHSAFKFTRSASFSILFHLHFVLEAVVFVQFHSITLDTVPLFCLLIRSTTINANMPSKKITFFLSWQPQQIRQHVAVRFGQIHYRHLSTPLSLGLLFTRYFLLM